MNHESLWKKFILALTRITIVYSIVSIAVVALAFRFLVPLLLEHIPGIWGEAACRFPDYSVYCSILAGYYDKKESFG